MAWVVEETGIDVAQWAISGGQSPGGLLMD